MSTLLERGSALIAELEEEIATISQEKAKEQQRLSAISKFLKDYGLETLGDLGSLLSQTTDEIDEIELHLAEVRSRMTSDDDV